MLDLLMPLLARVLTPLFSVGMLGAAVVVTITILRDVMEFVQDENPERTPSSNR